MKIGVFGGTFNPPHKGHRFLVDHVVARLGLDRVIIIPSHIPPHKTVADNAPEHRMAMARLAFPDYEVSDMEWRRKGTSYTVDTLRQLQEENPGDRLYLICGSDMFLTIDQWRDPQGIFQMAHVVTAGREKHVYLKLLCKKVWYRFHFGARCRVLYLRPLAVSSSEIREGEADAAMIEPAVRQYMQEHQLYHEL